MPIVTVYVVLYVRFALGVNVIVVFPAQLNVPVTPSTEKAASADASFIASLNIALIVVATATSAAPSAGDTKVMVGAVDP